MNLEDLKTLNLKDIGGWPVMPKMVALLLLLVAVVFAGYWFDWKEQLEQLDATRQEEAKLRDTFLAKKKQAVNLDTYRQQLKEIDQSFGALLKQLPNKSEMDALLVDINQAGLGRGLEFELFKPGDEANKEFYAELPIQIRVIGDYLKFGTFVSGLASLPRIVTVHNVKIARRGDAKGKDPLVMDATVKTYRYLEETAAETVGKAKTNSPAKK